MKLMSVPAPGTPGRSYIAVIKVVRAVCGINLKDAKRLCDRVKNGERVNLPLLPGELVQEVMNDLLDLGCSVRPDDAPSREQVAEVNEEALFVDGLDSALIGYVTRLGQPSVALYDREKCLRIFMADASCHADVACTEEETCEQCYLDAVEHFDFNVIGGWQGENTPAFATLLTRDDA